MTTWLEKYGLFEYALLDLAGNIEDERLMTESEAKKLNDDLWEKDRFILWVKM